MKPNTSVNDVLNIIPKDLFTNLENETRVDSQVKKLKWRVVFMLLLMSILDSEKTSLRLMEKIYNWEQFNIFKWEEDNRTIKHTGIAYRLSTINSNYFKKIFEFICLEFGHIIDQKQINNELWINIQKFDSTFVSISSKLLNFWMNAWWPKNSTKDYKNIKFTIWTNNLMPTSAIIWTTQKEVSEEISLKKAILESLHKTNWVVVFDRWLQNRLSFNEFNEEWISFVTRLSSSKNKNLRFKLVKKFKEVQWRKTNTWLKLEEDLIINLYAKNRLLKKEFRLIRAKIIDKTKKKYWEDIYFLTNITNMNAREITDIYKSRWDIEVFFKFIKQELNFKHFISRNLNWIKVMMYMVLIVSMLLLVYKHKNKMKWYKITKHCFVEDLNMEIIKEIVIHCNWDISKFEVLRKRGIY